MVLMEQIQVQPIGYVKNGLGRRRYNGWRETSSMIIVCENRPFKTWIHPTGNSEYPEMGAFATRTPNRPSKIALTTCRLLGIDGNVLRVNGLDAFDGSPVLDIKPYTKKPLSEVRTPDWVNELNSKISQKGK